MKFVFYDNFKPGLLKGEKIVDISDLLKSQTPQSLLKELVSKFSDLESALIQALVDREGVSSQSIRLRPPVPKPSIMLCAVGNYMEGVGRVRPWVKGLLPAFFEKAVTAIIGPGDTIKLPPVSATVFNHEAELAFVISKETRKVNRDEAMESVFGYTTFIDVSARGPEVSRRGPGFKTTFPIWEEKSYDTFAPVGPTLVTKDEVPDPHNLNIKLWVSGELRQDYNTSDMAHQIPEIIEFISEENVLNPGDLIACGTNHQGLGPIQDGDVVEIEIERIGRMSVKVVDSLKRTW